MRYRLKEKIRETKYEEATHQGFYTSDDQSFETVVKIEKDEEGEKIKILFLLEIKNNT